MIKVEMDIDIDVANRDSILELLEHRKASLTNGKPHNTGIYVTEIPHNPLTNVATIDYQTAASRGYFKIDILNVGIYDSVTDPEHLDRLVDTEPDWDLLLDCKFVDQLFHLSGHCALTRTLAPKNVDQLAALLAVMRPAKKHLRNKSWDEIFKEVWVVPKDNDYFFKKSHAYSYAMAVKVHMNILSEKLKA